MRGADLNPRDAASPTAILAPSARGRLALAPIAAAALYSAGKMREVAEVALLDPLTGTGNRRRFDSEGATLVGDDAARPLAVVMVMVDIDHFKQVNDTHGHPAGDALLTTHHIGPATDITVTSSFGVAVSDGGQLNDLVAAADAALYDAKQGGRNRVVTAAS